MRERVLIIGGAGFIGSHLTEGLLQEGYYVRVFDNLDPQVHGENSQYGHIPLPVQAHVEMIRADVRDINLLHNALKDVEIVFHLAAQVGVGQSMYEIERYVSVNSGGTGALLQLLSEGNHNVSRLLVASSMSAYGEGAYRCPTCGNVHPAGRRREDLIRKQWDPACPVCGGFSLNSIATAEHQCLAPTSVYAITKRSQEELCLSVGKAYDIPTTALRLFNTYGLRQSLSNPYTGVVAIFSSRLHNNKPPIIFEDGRQLRDFVHVADVVQAFMLAMTHPEAAGEVFNVGSGQPVTIALIAEAVAAATNVSIEPVVIPKFREGDIRHCYADISKIKKKLGYLPRVSLEKGIDQLIEWSAQQPAHDSFETAQDQLLSRNLLLG